MPFDLFPATRNIAGDKRKRGDGDYNDEAENQKNSSVKGGGKEVATATATDEEVEEFFVIMRKLHAATESIKKIDGGRCLLIGKRSKPISKEEEAAEIRGDKTSDRKIERSLSLDLNLEPKFTELDDNERRSHNLRRSSPDAPASLK